MGSKNFVQQEIHFPPVLDLEAFYCFTSLPTSRGGGVNTSLRRKMLAKSRSTKKQFSIQKGSHFWTKAMDKPHSRFCGRGKTGISCLHWELLGSWSTNSCWRKITCNQPERLFKNVLFLKSKHQIIWNPERLMNLNNQTITFSMGKNTGEDEGWHVQKDDAQANIEQSNERREFKWK